MSPPGNRRRPTRRNQRRRRVEAPEARPRRRLGISRLALASLALYAGYQLHYLLFEASYFKVREVRVLGAPTIGEDTVLRFAGVSLGDLAFGVDPPAIERRVELIPKVDRCKVRVPSPNVIELEVRERPEIARVMVDGRIHEVGSGGVVMGEAAPDSTAPLLLDAEIEPGPPRRLVDRQVARLELWFPILERPPTQGFTRVRFGGGGRLDVYWRGIRLVVDDPERFEKHRSFLGPVLADARERSLGFDYVDLRFQDVVVRYRPLGSPAVTAHLPENPSPSGSPSPAPAVDGPPPFAPAGAPPLESVADGRGNPQNGIRSSQLEDFMRRAASVYATEGAAPERGSGHDL